MQGYDELAAAMRTRDPEWARGYMTLRLLAPKHRFKSTLGPSAKPIQRRRPGASTT